MPYESSGSYDPATAQHIGLTFYLTFSLIFFVWIIVRAIFFHGYRQTVFEKLFADKHDRYTNVPTGAFLFIQACAGFVLLANFISNLLV